MSTRGRAAVAARAMSGGSVRDTRRTMPEESTSPDLVELWRQAVDAVNRDLDSFLRFLAPNAVWEAVDLGISPERALTTAPP